MIEVNFYAIFLDNTTKILISLLEKSYSLKASAYLIVKDKVVAQKIDQILWSSSTWLPHCLDNEDMAKNSPIIITTDAEQPFKEKSEDDQQFLFLFEDAEFENKAYENLTVFKKVFVIFNAQNEDILKFNRKRWKQWQQSGLKLDLKYYKQSADGKFEKV
ncbi:DNA polymerase III subunit chi [Candidatus Hepatincolaceae symbiont of Richtersius coronifer]